MKVLRVCNLDLPPALRVGADGSFLARLGCARHLHLNSTAKTTSVCHLTIAGDSFRFWELGVLLVEKFLDDRR